MEIMQVRDLKRSFTKGPNTIPVLKGINMEVHEGEFLSIIGQSGSGKSTLLHVMGLLTHPDEGEIIYAGERIDNQSERRRDYLRNHDISMIFNAIGAKLQQSGLKSALSFAAPAGFWQGIGGENRAISIIERGLFYIYITVCYTQVNAQVQICYSPQVRDRNYTDSVHAMRYSQWDLCAQTALEASISAIAEVAGAPLNAEAVLSNNYVFRIQIPNIAPPNTPSQNQDNENQGGLE